MKNILFCAVILLFVIGCKKNNDTGSNQMGSDIFPNKPGDVWVYRVNDTASIFNNPETISAYNMTISVTGSVQLPGIGTANIWVYDSPVGTDTNYVFQHGDTISFIAKSLAYISIIRQYIIPLRLNNSWPYSMNSIHEIRVDSQSAVIVGQYHFDNAFHIYGHPGRPDEIITVDEWVADHVGVVKRYINTFTTTNPYKNRTSWSLVSYQLE